MRKIAIAWFIAVLLTAAAASAAGRDDILGLWDNQEKDAQIELYTCGEKYCGRIAWMKNPNYPDGSKDGVPGTPKLDHNNPDPKLRLTPALGLGIVRNFTYTGGDAWVDGNVYDPKNGKTYSGKMTLTSPNTLKLRGFIGISLLGRTSTWTR